MKHPESIALDTLDEEVLFAPPVDQWPQRPAGPGPRPVAPNLSVEALVVLARRAVHPHYVAAGMPAHCQCAMCVRVELALRRVATGAERGRDDALAHTVLATRDATLGLAEGVRAVHERDAADAQDHALVRRWRERAASERADACAPRAMSPGVRSVHNHRGRVFDECANQLAVIHPRRPPPR
jgi:hypothetical protein